MGAIQANSRSRPFWQRHNDLEQTRPLVFCLPENAWNEILDEHDFLCENETARYFETRLTKEILWATEFETDRAAVAELRVPFIYTKTGWGVKEEIIGHNCRFLQQDDRSQEARHAIREAINEGRECQALIRNYDWYVANRDALKAEISPFTYDDKYWAAVIAIAMYKPVQKLQGMLGDSKKLALTVFTSLAWQS